MKNYFLFPLLLLSMLLSSTQVAQAHSAALATYVIQQNAQKQWTLTISVPLGGVHQALSKTYTQRDLWTSGHQYNVPLVQKYLINHSKILVNESVAVNMKALSFKLDDHQSNFVFALNNMPQKIEHFRFAINAMAENAGHINIVRVFKDEVKKKAVLQAYNEYSGEITLATVHASTTSVMGDNSSL